MADSPDRLYWRLLVLRCQVGDPGALEDLVRQGQPRLRAFLYKLLADPRRLDDLAQDIWMDVFRGLRHLREPEAFWAWFYRLAHHRVSRLFRGAHPAPLEDANALPEDAPEVEFGPEDAAAVNAALGTLPVEQREALLLRFAENLSYEQIARVMECQVGTVRSRLHYAKQALRAILDKESSHDTR